MDSYCGIPQNPNTPKIPKIQYFATEVTLDATSYVGYAYLPFSPTAIITYAGGSTQYLHLIEFKSDMTAYWLNNSTYFKFYHSTCLKFEGRNGGTVKFQSLLIG